MPNPSTEQSPRHSRHVSTRGFTEIPLHVAGHHQGESRFLADNLPDDAPTPILNPWRNNLTGLSQVHNLYFVCYEDEVHVYRPAFPSQRLSPQALLVIPLPRSSQHLLGYMPHSNAHSVNYVQVADLGQKEILLCACDDGDVLGFWTDTIHDAVLDLERQDKEWIRHDFELSIKKMEREQSTKRNTSLVPQHRRSPTSSVLPNDEETEPEVCTIPLFKGRPFFHVNVGISAWGLAVHTKLRLIAVSANNHQIHVFAFGLQSTMPDEAKPACEDTVIEEDTEEWEWLPTGKGSLLYSRDRNHYRLLVRHMTNIPSISFDNNTSTCALLVSADIAGRVITWNVDSGYPLHEMYTGTETSMLRGHLDPWTAGWGVMCIDRRAFDTAPDIVTAMGMCFAYTRSDLRVADISASRLNVRDAGEWDTELHRGFRGNRGPRADMLQTPQTSAEPDDTAQEDQPTMSNYPNLTATMLLITECNDTNELLRRNKHGVIPTMVIPRDFSRERALTIETSFMYTSTTVTYLNDETFVDRRTTRCLTTRTPLMLLQPQSVHMLQTVNLTARDATNPVIFLKDPLYQLTDDDLARVLHGNDRLNLFVQIPEIGAVLVGSPKGRVAVLTLWQLQRNPFNPDAPADAPPLYTFRLDHLLPLKQQEAAGARPMVQLVGLSAAPVQGCAGPNQDERWRCKRWRVMLLYRDHTLLCYELSRPPNAAFEVVMAG